MTPAKPHRHDYRYNLGTLCICGVTRKWALRNHRERVSCAANATSPVSGVSP